MEIEVNFQSTHLRQGGICTRFPGILKDKGEAVVKELPGRLPSQKPPTVTKQV